MKRVLSATLLYPVIVAGSLCSPAAAEQAATRRRISPPASSHRVAQEDRQQNATRRLDRDAAKEAERHYKVGVRHGLDGRFAEAIESFRESLAVNPQNADAYFGLGHAYYDSERFTESVAALREAAHVNGKDPETYHLLGRALSKTGNYTAAIEAFRQAVLLKPTWILARYDLGNAFYKSGQYTAAIGYYTEVTIRDSGQPEAYNDLGAAYAELGRHGEAFQAFAKAVQRRPSFAAAHNNLGLVHYRQRRYDQAVDAFEVALRHQPEDAVILSNLVLARAATADVEFRNALSGEGETTVKGQWLVRSTLDAVPGAIDRQRRTLVASNDLKSLPLGSVGQGSAAAAPTADPSVELPRTTKSTAANAEIKSSIASPVYPSAPAPIVGDSGAGGSGSSSNSGGGPGNDGAPESASSKIETADTSPANNIAETSSAASSTEPSSGTGATPVATEAGASAVAATEAAPAPTSIYRVGPGDVLDIRILNQRANAATRHPVLASGLLEYPRLGRPLAVVGQTTDEIKARLSSELERRAIVASPEVVVNVGEYASHVLTVSGLVAEPGSKIIRREAIPLYVVLADAQPTAKAGQVEINSHRTNQRTIIALSDKAATATTLVYPGDVLNVAERPPQFYYIGGSVSAPGRKQLEANLTLTQAILASGGSIQAGEQNGDKQIEVTRQGADARLTTVQYNLRDIMTGRIADPAVQAGDRIEIIK